MDRTGEPGLTAGRSGNSSNEDASDTTTNSSPPAASSTGNSTADGEPSGSTAPTQTDTGSSENSQDAGDDSSESSSSTAEPTQTSGSTGGGSSSGTMTSDDPTSSDGTSTEPGSTVPPPVTPKPEHLIDDFEDTDPALPRTGNRIGYWFTECSPDGTITPIDEVFVKPQDSGALYVAHVRAFGFEDIGSWAAFGVNLNDGDAYPDGVKYRGITFQARAGAGGSTKVRVEVRTIENDLPRGDAGALLNDDTYGRVLTIEETWKRHYVQWADATFQQQGWGDAFEFKPEHMTSISFKLAPQESEFDLWLDDIEFILEGEPEN